MCCWQRPTKLLCCSLTWSNLHAPVISGWWFKQIGPPSVDSRPTMNGGSFKNGQMTRQQQQLPSKSFLFFWNKCLMTGRLPNSSADHICSLWLIMQMTNNKRRKRRKANCCRLTWRGQSSGKNVYINRWIGKCLVGRWKLVGRAADGSEPVIPAASQTEEIRRSKSTRRSVAKQWQIGRQWRWGRQQLASVTLSTAPVIIAAGIPGGWGGGLTGNRPWSRGVFFRLFGTGLQADNSL